MANPTINRNLPWHEIRRAWETSEISMAALASKYGVSSVTTLKRRRTDEAWKRDADVVAANQSLADVISDAAALPGVAEAAEGPLSAGRLRGDRQAHGREVPAREPVMTRLAHVDRDVADGVGLASAEQLVNHTPLERVRETSFARQTALAWVAQDTSALLLRRIAGVLQPPSDEMDDARGGQEQDMEALGNLQRLIRINPDRETLAGLVAAGIKSLELGIAMERRAVADVVVKPAAGGDEMRAAQVQRNGPDMLKWMGVETTQKLRAWALEIEEERRAAEIAATTVKPAE
jgi:hypothetical protein